MKWVELFLVAAIFVRCGGADAAEPGKTSAAAPSRETVIRAIEVEIEKEPFGVGGSIFGLKFSADGRYFLYSWSSGIIDITMGKKLVPAVGRPNLSPLFRLNVRNSWPPGMVGVAAQRD